MTLTILPWYTGVILAMALFFGMHHVRLYLSFGLVSLTNNPDQIVTRVLLNAHSYTDSVTQSPYFCGIIFASFVWVGYCWATRLLHRMCLGWDSKHHASDRIQFRIRITPLLS